MLIDWFTVVAQLINFLVLVWLLQRFLFKPVKAIVAKRKEERGATREEKAGDAIFRVSCC